MIGEPDDQPAETLDTSDEATPTPLCFAADPVEAGLIVATLNDAGVEATVEGAAGWQMLWHMQVAIHARGLPVLVRKRDLAEARQVLAEVKQTQAKLASSGVNDTGDEEPTDAEPPADADIRRGFRASVIFFLSLAGMILTPYSIWLLWRGRSGWNSPDPASRRLNRRRLVVAWGFDLLMVAFVLFVLWLIFDTTTSFIPNHKAVPINLGDHPTGR
ncbi:MAG: hypothetical protein PHU85_08425 [Phycisphaerae bacterium]|nr:hypothetical protein [Phycisphaerae bacterium]